MSRMKTGRLRPLILNIMMTADERKLTIQKSQARGFRGYGEYLRALVVHDKIRPKKTKAA